MPNQKPTLIRTLNYRDLVVYGLAYIVPIAPLLTFGIVWDASGGLTALAYFIAAMCMYCTAKSYAVMTEIIPHAGSVYGMTRHCLGSFHGFMAGWLILLDYLLVPSMACVLIAVGMSTLVPGVDRSVWIFVTVAASLGINWFGLRISSRMNFFSAFIQFLIVFSLLAWGVWALYQGVGAGQLTLTPFYASDLFSIDKIYAATAICAVSFLGFDAISTLSEEVKSRDTTIVGKAIIRVLVIVGVIYVAMTWVLGDLMPGLTISDASAAIYEITSTRFSAWYAVVLAWMAATVIGLTNAVSVQIAIARVLFAMGRERQLPGVFSKLHVRHGTPFVAMMVASVISLIVSYASLNHIGVLVSFVSFGALSAFLYLHLCVLVEFIGRRKSKQYIQHGLIPILGIAITIQILIGMNTAALQLGLVWLAIGAIGAFFRRKM